MFRLHSSYLVRKMEGNTVETEDLYIKKICCKDNRTYFTIIINDQIMNIFYAEEEL